MFRTVLVATTALAVVTAAMPAAAQVRMIQASPGYNYFHRAGATMADHDTALHQCSYDAGRTSQPRDGGVEFAALLGGGLAMGAAMVLRAEQEARGRAANIENCMVSNGWNVVQLDVTNGRRLNGLVGMSLHNELAPLIGAAEPLGTVIRTYGNDAANGTNPRFGMAGEVEHQSLSILSGVSSSRGLLPTAPPPLRLPRQSRTAFPAAPLGDRDRVITADSTLVVIRITGDIRRAADVIAFERIGPDDATPAWSVDQRPSLFGPSLNDENVQNGLPRVFTAAYRLPPGRWRLIGMSRMGVSYSFCQGTMAFDARAGEALYLGSFDLSGPQMGPDLSPRDDLGVTPPGLRNAEYSRQGHFPCTGSYIYAIDPPAPLPAG